MTNGSSDSQVSLQMPLEKLASSSLAVGVTARAAQQPLNLSLSRQILWHNFNLAKTTLFLLQLSTTICSGRKVIMRLLLLSLSQIFVPYIFKK